MTTTDWTSRAACAGRFDLPWTADAADVTPWQAVTMAGICQTCPALLDCLAAVDDLEVTGGFWAGRDRDVHAVGPVPAPDWTVEPAPSTPAPVPAGEPVLCWIPRRSHGTPYEQGAFVLQSDNTGSWHLGGIAS